MSTFQRASRFTIITLVLAALAGCTATPPIRLLTSNDPDDPAVLEAVLMDFANGNDSLTKQTKSVLLFRSESMPLSEDFAEWTLTQTGENCKNREPFRASLLDRRSSIQLGSVLPTSPLWRIATVKESKASLFDLGSSVRNVIEASAPAYSADRQSALVIATFLWSVHSAQRTYVLTRNGSGWLVDCSDSFYAL